MNTEVRILSDLRQARRREFPTTEAAFRWIGELLAAEGHLIVEVEIIDHGVLV